MTASFSETVGTAAWRSEAERWVRDRAAKVGSRVTEAIGQPRIRMWSTQLIAPTDQGRLWFKANCPALAFEAPVHQVLARLDPAEVDAPVAVDVERGWVLTRDRGPTLDEAHETTVGDWQSVVALAAGLQRRLSGYGSELLAAGLPDCAPHTVPTRLATLVDAMAELSPQHPSHLDAAAARRLRGAQGLVEDSVATLLNASLPTATFQHGDLHPGNVFAVAGGLRVFDFGDAQWAHPLETLAVPWGWVERRTSLPWSEIVGAYASVWADVVDPAELRRLLPVAMVTHAVNRASTWWEALAGATTAEVAEWGESPRFFLELVLDPWDD